MKETLYFGLRNKKVLGGALVILSLLVLGLVSPLFTDDDPRDFVGPTAQRPSGEYWFGTTMFGQDVFVMFANGLRASFAVGVVAGGIGALVGMAIGFVAGYRGGLVDELLNMLTNVVLVLPVFVVLIVISAYLGINSLLVQSVVIGLFNWPWVARAVRAQTLSLRTRDFVDLARLTGMRPMQIVRREIAPNMSSYLLLVFILSFGGAVLFAATLDFLGLGPANTVSLGWMLNEAVSWSAQTLGMWWWFVPPGAGIAAIVGAAYVMNVGLDEVFNPKLREK
ncbi:ABC transporter permease [Desertimonas flava]|uniref:ABC transporter permease n=1 Tax=Desertimonas flava TaxID=2064846 RepID=UPI000E34FE0F|nr:ABC transporter permease [Desertimonas flava]